jgi:hypothetical protein
MQFVLKKQDLNISTRISLENQKGKRHQTEYNLSADSKNYQPQTPKNNFSSSEEHSHKKNERFSNFSLKKKKKGNWTEEEDKLLLEWVENKGPNNWTECSKNINGRCGKQCRERWVNALDPRIKRGNWEEQEHTLIFEQMKTNWSSWTLISKKLPGRTENAIKNYFYSSIRRLRTSDLFKFLRVLIFGEELMDNQNSKDFSKNVLFLVLN